MSQADDGNSHGVLRKELERLRRGLTSSKRKTRLRTDPDFTSGQGGTNASRAVLEVDPIKLKRRESHPPKKTSH